MTRDNKFYDDPINSDDRRKERLYHLEREMKRLARAKGKPEKTEAKTVYINSGGGGGDGGTLLTHELGGVNSPHTGTLQDIQAPQFLKTDGSRMLTGSMSVDAGITIDGVDLDVLEYIVINLKADKAITLTAGLGLTGGGDLSANRTFDVGVGDGITVGEDTVSVDLNYNFTWMGVHSFQNITYASSIMPHYSDSFDLGSSASLWRNIWASELSAIVFAQYTQVLLGGWFTVSKGEGVLEAAISTSATSIVLDTTGVDIGDIIIFRGLGSTGNPQVEYMKITGKSGTIYSVTRNLDGSGANAWPAGSVYANYGTTGNGRIELNAYDTPRISVFSHANTIAGYREQVRIGDLINGWGYSTSTYGSAFGAYESGKANITIDPINGIRLRNYNTNAVHLDGTKIVIGEYASGKPNVLIDSTGLYIRNYTINMLTLNGSTAVFGEYASGKPNVLIDSTGLYVRNYTTQIIKLTGTEASFENVIKLGTYGRLQQGTGTWGTNFTGSAIWSEGSPAVMNIGGWNNNVKQWWGGSDGDFFAGLGDLKINQNGITIASPTSYGKEDRNNIKWHKPADSLTILFNIGAWHIDGNTYGRMSTNGISGKQAVTYIQSVGGDQNATANVTFLASIGDTNDASLELSKSSSVRTLAIQVDNMNLEGGGLHVGGTSDPGDNNLVVDGTIKDGSGVEYLKTTGKAADSEKLDGVDSTGYATAGHNHDATYLGISAKAADSEKLDGLDSTAFLLDNGWQSYTPTWTASTTNPSIGNGTLSGRYIQIGKLVYCQFKMVAGSTTTFGSGEWRFSYPISPNTSYIDLQVGSSLLADAGVGYYSGVTRYGGATFMTIIVGGVAIHASAPFTWTNGDLLTVNIIYEAA